MDEVKNFYTPADMVLPGERENIRRALLRHFVAGWTSADEDLALRLYVANSGWSADRAVVTAMRLTKEWLTKQ